MALDLRSETVTSIQATALSSATFYSVYYMSIETTLATEPSVQLVLEPETVCQ